MTEFTFDFRWQDRLKLRDWEDFEDKTGVAWDDWRAGGVLRTDKDGKVLFDSKGEPLRVLTAEMKIGFIWLVKRTEDPDLTMEDVRNLPASVIDEITARQLELLNEVLEEEKKALKAETEKLEASASARSAANRRSRSGASKK